MSLAALAGLKIDPDALARLSPAEQEQVRDQLRVVEEEFKQNPLLGYRPHVKQAEFHQLPSPRSRLFIGGNRSGKTTSTHVDTIIQCVDREIVRAGEWVVGSDPEGNARPVRVLDVFCNGFQECERFSFGRRSVRVEIEATAEHRIAMTYQRGTRVRALGGANRFWSAKRALGFEPLTPQGEHEEFALLLGLLLGDGSFHDGGPQGRICAFHSEEAHMMALMGGEAERVGLRLTPRGAGTVTLVQRERSPRGWFLDFAQDELGLSCKAHEKQIPAMVENWSNEAVSRLLAGLFLTDGWVTSDGRCVGIQLTSRTMVEQIKRLLELRFGIHSGELRCRHYKTLFQRPGWTIKLTSHPALERFLRCVPLTGRKRELLEAGLTLTRYAKDSSSLRFLGSEPIGEQLVWDLHVDHPDHLFVLANGLITHNSGKTTSGMGYGMIQCLPPELVPEHLRDFKRWGWDGPCFGRVVTPDLTSTMEGVVLQKLRDWCPPEALKGGSVDRAFDKVQRTVRFKRGDWIQFMSNDQDLDKFGGTALHWVLFDEEPRQDIYNECLMRLIDFGGEALFTMTPLQGMSWIYDEFFEPWENHRLDEADVRVIVVDMDDNPHLSEEGKRVALQGLSREERQARKSGRFVSFAGLIYPNFSTLMHVIPEEDELPENVECFEGLDPGMRHMAAVVFCYLDSDDRLVVYDELAVQGKTVGEVAKQIKLKREGWGVTPNWTVVDPASRNRNSQTGRSDQQEYVDHGIVAFPGQNDVRSGINRVRERLEASPPRLLISSRCVELRAELKKYRWQKDSKRSENAPAERPVKKDDHLCFVAGTLIWTDFGAARIEEVTPGDRVWTRQGLFPVLHSHVTRKAPTRVLSFEDGRELRGTKNHPVYVSGRGWTPLGDVRYGDTMWVWDEHVKKSSGTASSSTAIRTRRTRVLATISRLLRSVFTVQSGSFITDRSGPDTRSTTLTAIPPTTTSPTWNAFLRASISPDTGPQSVARASAPTCAIPSVRPQMRGIAHRTGSLGTESTRDASSLNASQLLSPATTAANGLRARNAATSGSAQTSASPRGDEQRDSMTLTESVNGAAPSIEGTGTRTLWLAPLRVVANSRGRSAEVFNLTVLGPSEYFANGLLVHNCDALRYVCMQRPLAPDPDMPRENETMKDRLLRHHLKRLTRKPQMDSGFGPGIFQ